MVVDLFERCNRPMNLPNGVVPTIIYCRNEDVARENRDRLALLPEEADSSTFTCNEVYFRDGDGGGLTVIEGQELEIRDRVFPVEHLITLKVGAPVLLCKNMDATHVNGSRGVVSGFVTLAVFRDPATMLYKYLTTEEYERLGGHERFCSRTRVGDRVMVRRRRLPYVMMKKFPVVRFLHAPNVDMVITPEDFEYSSPSGTTVRQQIPLRLAWACTIHKVQGMELEYVIFSFRGIWESHGMVYTACSRSKEFEKLQVIDYDSQRLRRYIGIDGVVGRFYGALEQGREEMVRALKQSGKCES